MKDFVFVSVAFGEAYVAQQDRLKESILAIYPDANLLFWRDGLPEKSKPFLDSLYGFKVHAIQEAIDKGFKRVLWLDPAMILCRHIDWVGDHMMVAVKDENRLSQYISDWYLESNLLSRDDVKKLHLVGGSLYYFDFNFTTAEYIFTRWKMDEKMGLFGSQTEEATGKLQGHRADESCMALSIYSQFHEPVAASLVGYCVENNPVFIKKHFK
jgi:hypothetical protein